MTQKDRLAIFVIFYGFGQNHVIISSPTSGTLF